MQHSSRLLKRTGLATAVAAATMAVSLQSQALDFEFDNNDLKIDWDTNVTYGVMWRVQGRDSKHQTDNTDDGTNNFDTGIVSNKISVVSEADFQWGNYGFFVRGKALYDYRYQNQDTDMSRENYFTDNSGDGDGQWTTDIFGIPVGGSAGDLARKDFHDDTKDIHGKDAFFLDAFLYGDFVVADRLLQARLGRQVVSWGESAFYQGISGTQSHVDAAAAQAPGTEVKEIFMPIGQLYANLELSPSFNLEAYYQYEWKKTQQAGVGSYWSNADVTGAGAERLLIIQQGVPVFGTLAVPFDVIREDEPDGTSEEDSWGVALRYFMEDGTELGFYRTTYHDKYPSVRGLTDENPALPPLAAFPEAQQDYYARDIDLYGVSFSTLVGEFQVNGEISYHDGAVPTQTTLPTLDSETGSYYTPEFQTGHVTQANLGFLYILGNNFLSDGINVVGETAYVRTNLSPGDLKREQNIGMINTKNAWGYTLSATLNYKSVMPGLDIDVPISFKDTPSGVWKTLTMQEGAKSASVGMRFKYLGDWKGNLKYTTFWGAKSDHRNHDRDNISFDVTYSF
jgi:Protein of unknown function (DUF1302)